MSSAEPWVWLNRAKQDDCVRCAGFSQVWETKGTFTSPHLWQNYCWQLHPPGLVATSTTIHIHAGKTQAYVRRNRKRTQSRVSLKWRRCQVCRQTKFVMIWDAEYKNNFFFSIYLKTQKSLYGTRYTVYTHFQPCTTVASHCAPHCLKELLAKPVVYKAKQCCPPRKALSAIFGFPKLKIPSSFDKTAAIHANLLSNIVYYLQ